MSLLNLENEIIKKENIDKFLKISSKEIKKNNEYIFIKNIKISQGVFFTNIYILSSIFLTIINRKIFQKYKFTFNFTFLFIQQFFSCIAFNLIFKYSRIFKSQIRDISFKDFKILKYYYIFFTFLFDINNIFLYIGNQLVTNTAMFLMLRKFLLVFTYLYDFFINKKNLNSYILLSVLLNIFGSIISGLDDVTFDLKGYFLVFISNLISLFYSQISEKFKKRNGVPNLKLLIYNSYLNIPILLIFIFLKGEYKELRIYFNTYSKNNFGFYIRILASCLISVIMNCSNFICNEKISSLYTQLFGNFKDIIITFLSLITLKDFVPTIKTFVGFFLSTFGSILFSIQTILKSIRIKNLNYKKNNFYKANKKIINI